MNESSKIRGEYVFVVDRSGSMEGDRMKMTKDVLVHLLDMLPPDYSKFQIISFGSHYTTMFEEVSVNTTNASVRAAQQKVSEFQANYGGTEMFFPLDTALNAPLSQGYPRSIFLITDGQVWNEDAIVKQVKKATMRDNIRVYTVGIGNGVSRNLIRSIAEEGKGKHEFISEAWQMKLKLVKMLQDSITPFLDQFAFTFNESLVKIVAPLPWSIKAVRKNEPFTVFIFFSPELAKIEQTRITLKCHESQTGQNHDFAITVAAQSAVDTPIIHKLGVHRLIKSFLSNALLGLNDFSDILMPDKDSYYRQIRDFSLRFQVLSELTAFVLVDTEEEVKEKEEDNNNINNNND